MGFLGLFRVSLTSGIRKPFTRESGRTLSVARGTKANDRGRSLKTQTANPRGPGKSLVCRWQRIGHYVECPGGGRPEGGISPIVSLFHLMGLLTQPADLRGITVVAEWRLPFPNENNSFLMQGRIGGDRERRPRTWPTPTGACLWGHCSPWKMGPPYVFGVIKSQ